MGGEDPGPVPTSTGKRGRYGAGHVLRPFGSLADEGQQRLVHLGGVRPQQAVRRALDLDVLRLWERLVEGASGGVDREDVVAGAVQDQWRLVCSADRGHVLAEVL